MRSKRNDEKGRVLTLAGLSMIIILGSEISVTWEGFLQVIITGDLAVPVTGRVGMKAMALLGRLAVGFFLITATLTYAQELASIRLPEPQMEGGRPLMEVLKDRKSSRAFSAEKLPSQVLSNMLWAAFGVNRPDSGKRTAPSARNWQEIDIYVATADGLYFYDARGHMLRQILAGDIRAMTGRQTFVGEVPVNLIYVADFSRMVGAADDDKVLYSGAATGFISQNVYLYCASEGLATVVRGLIDRPALAKAMKLRTDQKVILSQSVGYPKK